MNIVGKFKSLVSFLFNKDTLIKIILVQVIVVLLASMERGGFVIYHKGTVFLDSTYGGFEIKNR